MDFLRIFDEELVVKCRLKSLKLMSLSPSDSISACNEKNLKIFLRNQRKSLEAFSFEYESDTIGDLAFQDLQLVTSLGLLKTSSDAFERNSRITNLEIPHVQDFLSIKKFIDAAPNLESLYVGSVSKELVEYLAWNFKKLQLLNYKTIGLDVEDHYEQLKREQTEVNKEIEIWDYENLDWD